MDRFGCGRDKRGRAGQGRIHLDVTGHGGIAFVFAGRTVVAVRIVADGPHQRGSQRKRRTRRFVRRCLFEGVERAKRDSAGSRCSLAVSGCFCTGLVT